MNKITQTIQIDGMHCAACSSRIEKVLSKTAGVITANVNLATGSANVVFDKDTVSLKDLKFKIADIGFVPLVSDERDVNEEEIKNAKRSKKLFGEFLTAIILSVILMIVSMGHMLGLHLPNLISPDYKPFNFALLQLVLTIPVLYCGREFFVKGFRGIIKFSASMDTLIALGSSAALVYSIYASVKLFNGEADYVHSLYYESAAMIISFMLLGRFMENKSKFKAAESMYALMRLAPKTATLRKNDTDIEVQSDDVEVGDIIVVKPGQSIPVDAIITAGNITVDESMLTGESIPNEKSAGDKVFGGTVNGNSAFTAKACSTTKNSAVAGIADLVAKAQGSKAPVAKLADKIASVFVPSVFCIALISAILWLIFGKNTTQALTVFISVLVVACPCALGLATPTAVMVGTGSGAKKGILIKSGEALQRVCKTEYVVFDKTGTITNGKPEVTDVIPMKLNEAMLLSIAYGAEKDSEHPLGAAVVKYAKDIKIKASEAYEFKSIPGRGISCVINNNKVIIGNIKLLEESGIDSAFIEEKVNMLSSDGKTPLIVCLNADIAGIIAVSDIEKAGAKEAIATLKSKKIYPFLLTGDNALVANAIAKKTGIESVYASLLPGDKVNVINELKKKGCTVMVGDGINDAPSLAAADIGIAMGTGTDVAMESADIVLMQDNLDGVDKAISLSKKTMRIIKQNLFWAFAYNTILIPVAAGILYLFSGPMLNPMIAALAMSLSSVTVVGNSLRLR